MSAAVVFAFAVEENLPPVVGAATYEVLSRQLPRLVVQCLNGKVDKGLRFFPLMGPVEGERQFFTLREMLPPEKLCQLHGQSEGVRVLMDGRIEAGGLNLRIVDAVAARPLLEELIPFSPLEPFGATQRLLFELGSALGFEGSPPRLPGLEGWALSYYLAARDDLLALEAGIAREEGRWLVAIRRAFELAPDSPEVQKLCLEICSRLVTSNRALEETAALLVEAIRKASSSSDLLGPAISLLDDMGRGDRLVGLLREMAAQIPLPEAAALRLAAHHSMQGRWEDAETVLQAALARRPGDRDRRSPLLLAQMMVTKQQLGKHGEKAALIEELRQIPDLPPQVGRVVAAELTDQVRPEAALSVAERCLLAHSENAGLWLEKARALMHLGEGVAARSALETILALQPGSCIRQEAERLLRYVHAPEILDQLRQLDEALAAEDPSTALSLARKLVRAQAKLSESWLFLGVVRQRLQQPRRAIRAYRRALALDPELGEAHNRLGILLVGKGQHRQGLLHIREAIARLPTDAGAHVHLAQAHHYLGEDEAGRAALAEAQRLGADPKLVEAVRQTFFPDSD